MQLLTETQKEFLCSNNIQTLLDNDSATIIFMREMFNIDKENTPLEEPLLLWSIFEFVLYCLYLFAPEQVVNTYNKRDNYIEIYKILYNKRIDTVLYNFNLCKETVSSIVDKTLLDINKPLLDINKPLLNVEDLNEFKTVAIKYNINPFKKLFITNLTARNISITTEYKINFNPKILSYTAKYVVDSPLEFVYKIINVYEELIDLMPLDKYV